MPTKCQTEEDEMDETGAPKGIAARHAWIFSGRIDYSQPFDLNHDTTDIVA
jgi:hypothetical protein